MARVFHKCNKGRKIMALKLDLTKPYDSLEWGFIRDTLVSFCFLKSWLIWLCVCITTSKIQVLWNGEIINEFSPSRGITQGDPLSSYNFVLFLDKFSTLIEQQVGEGYWKPLKLTHNIGFLMFSMLMMCFSLVVLLRIICIISWILLIRLLKYQVRELI